MRPSSTQIDGGSFMNIDVAGLRSLGFTLGSSKTFVSRRKSWLGSYGWPPSDVLDYSTFGRQIGPQFNLSATFYLEKINTLDEENFEVEIELMLMLSWEDPRIFARCDNAGVGGFDDDDPCGLFWQPKLLWPNLKLDPHPAATLEPTILEDFGLTTIVGKATAEAGAGDPPSSIAEKSIGSRMYRVRATVMTDLNFRGFPYDRQQLNVSIQMPFNLPIRKAKFVSQALPQPINGPGSGGTPIWEIICVTTDNTVLDFSSVSSPPGTRYDPMSSYYATVMALPPEQMLAELSGGASASTRNWGPEFSKWSQATMTVHVQRLVTFYDFNFVVVVALLCFVSFFSLIISPSALDSRLGLTLTVVLGLNVFQIVVIDNTPETGYLTTMHSYCLLATMLVVGVAIENILAYWADQRHAKVLYLAERLKSITGSEANRSRAIRVQAAIKGFLTRRRRQRAAAAAGGEGRHAGGGGGGGEVQIATVVREVPAPGSSKGWVGGGAFSSPAPIAPSITDSTSDALGSDASKAKGRPPRAPSRRVRPELAPIEQQREYIRQAPRATLSRRLSRRASRILDKVASVGAAHLDHAFAVLLPVLFAMLYVYSAGLGSSVNKPSQSVPGCPRL